jgi:predicted HAD superfamily Cof-like phosphohydrolase
MTDTTEQVCRSVPKNQSFGSKPPWRLCVRHILRLGPSAAERRLRGYIVEECAELQRRRWEASDSGRFADLAKTITALLDRAFTELKAGDLDTANLCMLAARRHQIWAYEPAEIEAAKLSLSQEGASEKIRGWRRAAISSLLQDLGNKDENVSIRLRALATDDEALTEIANLLTNAADRAAAKKDIAAYLGKREMLGTASERFADLFVTLCSDTPTVQTVAGAITQLTDNDARDRVLLYQATHVLDEGLQNDYRKLHRLQSQLFVLSGALILVVLGLLILAFIAPITLSEKDAFGARIVGYVCLFGALGGCISAIQSLARNPTMLRIPEQLMIGSVTFIRPLLGSAAAIAVYVFLIWGILPFRSDSNVAVLGAAFIGGFSERLIVYAVGTVTGKGSGSIE